jgi:hypothetical protein
MLPEYQLFDDVDPAGTRGDRRVQLLTATVQIQDMTVTHKELVDYLRRLPADKRDRALVHILDVGITEILRRRPGH